MKLKKKKAELIDLPGHPRAQTECFIQIKEAGFIIFLVDSETFMKQVNVIANLLYDVLCQIQKKVPVLIVGSKIDIFGSTKIETIKSELENEINYIRSNRHHESLIANNDDELNEHKFIFLGDEDSSFSFDQLKNEISFHSYSAKTGGLSEIRDSIMKFISRH